MLYGLFIELVPLSTNAEKQNEKLLSAYNSYTGKSVLFIVFLPVLASRKLAKHVYFQTGIKCAGIYGNRDKTGQN